MESQLITNEIILFQFRIYSISDSVHVNSSGTPDYFNQFDFNSDWINFTSIRHSVTFIQHKEWLTFIYDWGHYCVWGTFTWYTCIPNYLLLIHSPMAVLMWQVYQVGAYSLNGAPIVCLLDSLPCIPQKGHHNRSGYIIEYSNHWKVGQIYVVCHNVRSGFTPATRLNVPKADFMQILWSLLCDLIEDLDLKCAFYKP